MELLHDLKPGENMTDEIITAVVKEAFEILKSEGGTIIFKTDYLPDQLPNYSMPLIIIDVQDNNEAGQMVGGATRMDWNIAFNSYFFALDGTQNIASFNLKLPIDKIRIHFAKGNWKTKEMPNIETDYGFKLTLSSITGADALDEEGLIKGFRINLDSIAIDLSTSNQLESDPVKTVNNLTE